MSSRTRSWQFARRESSLLAAARICALACLVLARSVPVMAQSGGAAGDTHRGGDFEPGDRIIVITRGDTTRVDTVTVASDRTITLQQLPPISLDGVQRSGLQSCLDQQLQQYVRHTVVRAIPLVSVGVLGAVVHPGYYRVPLQINLGDLLMVAGGPSPQADMMRVQVRRGRATLLDDRTLRDAIVRGVSLDDLGIDAGDEVLVGTPPQRNWLLITQIAGVATGLLLTLHTLKLF